MLRHGGQGRQQPVGGEGQQGLRLHTCNEVAELLQLAWSGQLSGGRGEDGVRVRTQKYKTVRKVQSDVLTE